MGDKLGTVETLPALAPAVQEHDVHFAVSLWGATQSLREITGAVLPLHEQGKYEQHMSQARSAMGADAFAAAWEAGRALTWEQATDYALERLDRGNPGVP